MGDEHRRCVRCGNSFIWSYGEQRFYAEHRLSPPLHCPNCRPQRRRERDAGGRGLAGAPAKAPITAEERWAEAERFMKGGARAEERPGCLSRLLGPFRSLFRRR